MAGDVFISYRRSDQALARLLHALLKARGVEAWYDAHVGAGDDWRRVTAKALDAAPIFVLLFSKEASESDDIGKELAAATFSRKLVVPVRIEDIRPSGEFLYELASRNWFDAFEDVEARFEILADKLAQMVKDGARANAAPGDVHAAPLYTNGPALARVLKRPVVRGGLAAAALMLVAVVAMIALRPQSAAPRGVGESQLIAFFEYTPMGDDPVVKATADAATDRMFGAIRANLLGAVARTETRNTPEDMRFGRAAALGARYALGGEMRPEADGMTLAIHFEDVASRLTLWERSFTSSASDAAYLPAQAALQASEAMWCIIKTRSELTRDTPEILKLIADRCREGGGAGPMDVAYMAARMRAVAQADPDSAFNQAQLVMMLGLGVSEAPPSAQAAWIAEAEAAVQRAERLDPDEPGIYLARITLDQARQASMGAWDATILEAVSKAEGKDSFVFGQSSAFRFQVLRSAGRFREAQAHIVAAVANDPLTSPWSAGLNQAVLGRKVEARSELEPALVAYGPWVWSELAPYAIFFDAADADAMLRSPPSSIPKPTVACLRDMRAALASRNAGARALGAQKVRACGEAKTLGALSVLAALTALDDVDGAFELAGKQAFNQASVWSGTLQALFWPAARTMRNDPRFLPLVEKLGLMDYWRATASQPDICETESAPFCAATKAAATP